MQQNENTKDQNADMINEGHGQVNQHQDGEEGPGYFLKTTKPASPISEIKPKAAFGTEPYLPHGRGGRGRDADGNGTTRNGRF